MHEVTTFRRDVRHDGRHAVVEYGVSLDEDLSRRDFTINAIAFSPSTGELRDPFGGQGDLKARVVRAVGEPSARMVEDRLRALRAFRFAGRFEFDIDPATWSAILESAPHLPRLSRERVRQEVEKTMDQVRWPSRSLLLWKRSGAFASLIPHLGRLHRHAGPDSSAGTRSITQPEPPGDTFPRPSGPGGAAHDGSAPSIEQGHGLGRAPGGCLASGRRDDARGRRFRRIRCHIATSRCTSVSDVLQRLPAHCERALER
jgi:hypothetical protein